MDFLKAIDWGGVGRVWAFRLFVMAGLAFAVIGWFLVTDPDAGKDTMLRLQFMSWAFVVAGPAYMIRRALGGEARSHEAWRKGMSGSLPAAIMWLGQALVGALVYVALLLGCLSTARAAEPAPQPPAAARALLPVLKSEQLAFWQGMPDPATLGAQVEQETCPSLRSRMCWSPHAELKTPYEYGVGLGQVTITKSFDNFAAARGLDPSLRDWQFADRFDPRRQLRTLVLTDRGLYRALGAVPGARDRLAMTFAAYNGGLGGVRSDRRLCAAVRGCDPGRWFGNVELHSLKARAARAGYGQSAFAINRGYVRNVLIVRRVRYAEVL